MGILQCLSTNLEKLENELFKLNRKERISLGKYLLRNFFKDSNSLYYRNWNQYEKRIIFRIIIKLLLTSNKNYSFLKEKTGRNFLKELAIFIHNDDDAIFKIYHTYFHFLPAEDMMFIFDHLIHNGYDGTYLYRKMIMIHGRKKEKHGKIKYKFLI
jgi:hypothetical protein